MGAHQSGQVLGQGPDHASPLAGLHLLLPLETLPHRLVFWTHVPRVAEDMGMAADHLRDQTARHRGKIEPVFLLRDHDLEREVEQEVSQLVHGGAIVACLQRVRDFVGFLDQVGKERARSLLAVPGTTVRRAQPAQEGEHALEARFEAVEFRRSIRLFHGGRS